MKKKTQTQAQGQPEITPIKGLSRGDVIGRENSYIHTKLALTQKGQIWLMMDKFRMIQIFTYALNKFAMIQAHRQMVEDAIDYLKTPKP